MAKATNVIESCIKECNKALYHSLPVNWSRFTKSGQSMSSLDFVLTSDKDSEAEDLTALKVVPFVHRENSKFWVSVSLSFSFVKRAWTPTSAKIIVFSGDASDIKKFPLLRAEWEQNLDGEPEAIHAQPHWHVYTQNLQQQTQFPGVVEFESPEFPINFIPGDVDLSLFHFAMEANWHSLGPGNQQQLLGIVNLRNWIDGCISYISGQLNYLCLKRDS